MQLADWLGPTRRTRREAHAAAHAARRLASARATHPPAPPPSPRAGTSTRPRGAPGGERTSCWTSWTARACSATRSPRHAAQFGPRPAWGVGVHCCWLYGREAWLAPGARHLPPHASTRARAAGGDVRGVPPPRHQGLLDVRHGHLRVLHPQAPLEGVQAAGWVEGWFERPSRAFPSPAQLRLLARSGVTAARAPPPPSPRPPARQGDTPLHWPLVNSDHMQERLGRRELERKRVDDARVLELQDPNHRWEVSSAHVCLNTRQPCRATSRPA